MGYNHPIPFNINISMGALISGGGGGGGFQNTFLKPFFSNNEMNTQVTKFFKTINYETIARK